MFNISSCPLPEFRPSEGGKMVCDLALNTFVTGYKVRSDAL